MLAAALPYFHVHTIAGVQVYALFVFAAVALGVLVMFVTARRYGVPSGDSALLLIALFSAIIAAHLWDVVAYQLDEDPVPWLRWWSGLSLFGALVGVALTVWIIALARRRDLALYADIVAMACLVAIGVGRIGCALVHDHPGVPTDSMFGFDFPTNRVSFLLHEPVAGGTVRLHDLGFEELLVVVPLTGVAIVLLAKRLRAGMMAVIVAIAFATARFLLDFLRLRETEPLHGGLTAGQWGCVMVLVVAGYGLVVGKNGRVAPLASELGDKPGGLAP